VRRGRRALIESLEASMPAFVELLADHRPAAFRGRTVREAVTREERHPERLAERYRAWLADPRLMHAAPPSLVFAVLGKARHADVLSATTEEAVLRRLLERWALGSPLPAPRAPAPTDPLVLTT
jgi:hypothetical protein